MLLIFSVLATILICLGVLAILFIAIYLVCYTLAYFKIGDFRIDRRMILGDLVIFGCAVVVLLGCIFGVKAISSYQETIKTAKYDLVSMQDSSQIANNVDEGLLNICVFEV